METTQLTQQTQTEPETSHSQYVGSLIPPRKTAAIEALLKVNNVDHHLAKKYLEEFAEYQKNLENHLATLPKKEEIILPELKPINIESLYDLFKSAFELFQKKPFDETVNNSESKRLARTICAYFLQKKAFFRSPLLNEKSIPDMQKGLMIVGGYGTGKTSILNTFHQMFKTAASMPIQVTDIEGTLQLLGRYKLSFGYFTANDIVKTFEAISDPQEKEIFWNRHSKGIKYFDDIMTESTASNYGKIEIFKDLFEMRYTNRAKTLISLNYAETLDETLDEISKKYGERVYDRLFEMFNIIELHGESLRK